MGRDAIFAYYKKNLKTINQLTKNQLIVKLGKKVHSKIEYFLVLIWASEAQSKIPPIPTLDFFKF